MSNHRISTTISQKHWELLKRHVEKFETQQRTLERALESLENVESNSKKNSSLTYEDKYWMLLKATKLACFIQKDALKILLNTVDYKVLNEYIVQHKPIEYAVEYYIQKPLKECSLIEVIDGLVIITKLSNWFDTVDLIDGVGYYTLLFTHSLGFNSSKLNTLTFESLFKSVGVRTETMISEKTIFIKIFKDQ
jgi:hypothetical protein